ncbi:MAG: DUF6338 family protein [Vicinamibacterales bacterium]
MEIPGKAVIDVLTYLLPGFIAAAVFYSLTPSARPIPFERVVQALMFTMLVQVGVVVVQAVTGFASAYIHLGLWTENTRLVWSVVLAGVLGLCLGWMQNSDGVHSVLRKTGATCQTSFPSEWYGAFSRNKGYVVLHLKGERRLYGWPEEWPSVPGQGQFVMANAEWLDGLERIPLSGVRRVMVNGLDVEMVEFMEVAPPEGDIQYGRTQAADASAAHLSDQLAEPGATAPVEAGAASTATT